MPNQRNPSLFLTQKQVDDIADRILEGKYSKRPVKPIDVFHAGFYGEGAYLRGYIEARFKLTPAGTTRRTNKFQSLVSTLARQVPHSTPTAVWKVKRGYYDSNGFTYVMGPGGTEAEKTLLKEGAMLINMEWGGFGSSGAHAFFMLPFLGVDHALAFDMQHPGRHLPAACRG